MRMEANEDEDDGNVYLHNDKSLDGDSLSV